MSREKNKRFFYLNKETAELTADPSAFMARNAGFLFLFCAVVPWPVSVVLNLFRNALPADAYFTIGSLVPYAVMAVVCIAFIAGCFQGKASGLRPAKWPAFWLALLAQCAIYPLLLLVSDIFAYLTPGRVLILSEGAEQALLSAGPVAGYVILAAVPAAVEELLFRGAIYGALRDRGMAVAAIVSTACFSLIHHNLDQVAYTALFGIMLCFVREYSGSAFPCMLAHFALNSASVTSIYFPELLPAGGVQDAGAGQGFMESRGWLLAAAAVGIAAAAALLFLTRKACRYEKPEARDPETMLPMPITPFAVGWGICVMAIMLS